MKDAKVLDACCGSRMFWFDKQHPSTIYMDNRELQDTLCDGRTLTVAPDIVADFRCMPFEDDSFYLVVFDPPHLVKVGDKSWLAKKYGKLSDNWREDLKKGFDECMRVLKPNGTLVFKWNEEQVKLSEVIGAKWKFSPNTYSIYGWNDEDDDKFKEFFYLMEQDEMFGSYMDSRKEFDEDWEKGEYEPSVAMHFDNSDFEVIEKIERKAGESSE